jgi:diaminopimelate epimerase
MEEFTTQIINNGIWGSNTLKRIAIMYPSGNTTAVLFNQNPTMNLQQLNNLIMKVWSDNAPTQPKIEQCCFVTSPKNPSAVARVEMFGGEFCGNATRSVLSLITKDRDCQGLIEVSGANRLLEFTTKNRIIEVEMPLSSKTKVTESIREGTLVHLNGITQLVVTDLEKQKNDSPREMLIRLLRDNVYDLINQPAVGISYYNIVTSLAKFCVWVRNIDTMFDETACSSGTCAIGVTLATINKKNTIIIVKQPSGETIKTTTLYDTKINKVYKSTISGTVKKLFEKEFILS